MILLDSDHCIFFIRGHPKVVAAFEAHASDEPAISIITVGELYFGAMRSSRPEANLTLCKELIDRVEVIGLDLEIMLRFAQTKAELFRRGKPLEDPDLLIASTALAEGLTLVTRNTAHFDRIEGLRLEDWCV